MQQHALALLGRSLDEITRGDRLNGKRSTQERMWEIERMGLEALYENPARLNDPRIADWVENKILDAMLSAIALHGPRAHLPGAARLARRAEEYLLENLQAPLTIRDLCTAMGTMERTLHLAFRVHLGTTPKAHLKMLRLNAVRRALQVATPGVGVMDVAGQWGFFHAGWFSQDYRRMFGESPSRTLRGATGLVRNHHGDWQLHSSPNSPCICTAHGWGYYIALCYIPVPAITMEPARMVGRWNVPAASALVLLFTASLQAQAPVRHPYFGETHVHYRLVVRRLHLRQSPGRPATPTSTQSASRSSIRSATTSRSRLPSIGWA